MAMAGEMRGLFVRFLWIQFNISLENLGEEFRRRQRKKGNEYDERICICR